VQVVGHVHVVAPQQRVLGHAHHAHRQPRDGGDQQQEQQVQDRPVRLGRQPRGLERQQQRDQRDHHARRPAAVGTQVRRQVAVLHQPQHQPPDRDVDEQRGDHHADRGEHPGQAGTGDPVHLPLVYAYAVPRVHRLAGLVAAG